MTISSETLQRVRATASQQDRVVTTPQLRSAGADRNRDGYEDRSAPWLA